jgi:hypothetical protein
MRDLDGVRRREGAREHVALIVVSACSVVTILIVVGGIVGSFSTELVLAVVSPLVTAAVVTIHYYFPQK